MKFFYKLNFLLILTLTCSLFNIAAETYDPSASVFRFQKQMAKRGNAQSQFKLGLMYETGSGVSNSPVLATSWYKKAALQNHKPARNRLTYLEIKKKGFDDNHKSWLKALKNDARFNEGEALFLLGQMYSEGTAVKKDLKLALKLLMKAQGANIPGSESEIARVEMEVALLEKQENDKINILIPAAVAPAAKTITTPVPHPQSKNTVNIYKKKTGKPTVKQVNAKKTRTKTVSKNTQKTRKASAQPRKVKVTKAKNATIEKPAIKTKPAQTSKEKEYHPMDSICSGRNRFSRSCR